MMRTKVEPPIRVFKCQFATEDPLPRTGHEPGAAVHPVRARKPFLGPNKAAGTRTSLSGICQAAGTSARKERNRPATTRSAVPEAIMPPSRRSRTRRSGVSSLFSSISRKLAAVLV
jgi:hypothetical protein